MIGDVRKTDRAEEDRVVPFDLREPVVGHHRAGLRVALAAPVEMLPVEGEAVLARDRVEHAHPFGHDFFADPVARDRRDAIRLHCY